MTTPIVEIKHQIAPKRPGLRCADGRSLNMGGRIQQSKWLNVDEILWPAWTSCLPSAKLPLREFQSGYYGLLRAAGFSSNYAKQHAARYALNNSLVHAGIITITDE